MPNQIILGEGEITKAKIEKQSAKRRPKPTTHHPELPAPGPSVGLRFPWQPKGELPPLHLHRSASTATQHDEAELSAVEKINVGIARRLAKGEALVVVPGALVLHDGDAPVSPS